MRTAILLAAAAMLAGCEATPEVNVCTLEYRAAYLETHDNDAMLRRECPFGLSNQPMFVIHKRWDEIDKILEALSH